MKKIYQLGITMLLLLAAALPAAYAYNFQSGGIYYDITGTSPNTVAVTYATGSYNSYSGNVDIPSTVTYNGTTYTVTGIGNNAFRNCSGLTGVSIPGTVTSIGEYAFYYCWNLHSVDFPDALTSIGAYAFQQSGFQQGGLYSVTIPAAVVTIGTNAFGNCTSMTSVVFNATNCTSAPEVFKDCSHLNSLTIGNTVHKIPNNAFAYCTALKSLYIPSSVSSIEGNPFHHCTSLDTIIVASDNSVYSSGTNNNAIINVATHTLVTGCKSTIIPSSVTAIGAYAFSGSALTSLTIGPNVDSIGNSAFRECYSLSSVSFNADSCKFMGESGYSVFYSCNSLSSLLIGNNVKAIPAYAFNGCSHLTGMLIIPNSVKTIRNNAFYGCNGLTSLSIGNSVTSIGSSAFYGCNSMEGTLTIPQSLKSIGSSAFYNCSGFTSLVFNADSCIVGSFSGCSNISSLTIGNNVKMIPENAFNGLTHLTGVLTIPNAVVTIGNSAFKNCSGLTALTIGNAVATIGQSAFQGCSGLTSLTMGDAVTTIGKSAFQDCSGLSSLTIGDAVTTIGQSAFQGCSGLTFLIMGDAVTKIGQSAFQGCSKLTSLTVGSAVTTIGESAFQNCYSINGTLIIPDVVRSISNMAFSGCGGIDTIIIGRSVDTIGYEAFKDCNSLVHIVFRAESCAKIGAGNNYEVFTGCVNPATLEIGNNVKIVPHHLFKNFTGLSGTVIIPDSVNNIGTYSFDGCSNIDSLVIGKSVSSIGDYAFRNCSNLSYVEFNADSCISAGHYDGNYGNIYGVFGNECSHQTNLTIGSNVRNIPSCIFAYFTGISGKVTIPDSVKNIGSYAFYGCNNLDTLVIGHTVASIGESAFNNCGNLSFVAFYADSCVSMGSNYRFVFTGDNHPASLYIGDNVKAIPSNAFRDFIGLTNVVMGNSIRNISQYAFYHCSNLTSTILPNTLQTIGQYAFNGCESITSLVIPDSVISIGQYAFHDCSSLDSIIIGESVSTMGNVFKNCTALSYVLFKADSCVNNGGSGYGFFENCGINTTLIISHNVKYLPVYGAFKNFTGLTTVIYNADSCVTAFNDYTFSAFSGCNNFTHLTIGNNVKCIPSNLFYSCGGLSGTLVIPDSVSSIGGGSFRSCSGMDTVVIGRAVFSIRGNAFSYCSNLRTVFFNADSCTSMYSGSYTNYDVFYGCDSLTSLIIGSNVKAIPEYAFRGANLNGELIIPDAVTFIGQNAFYGCTGLTGTLSIPQADTIGYRAFYNCSGINSLMLGEGVKYIGGESFCNCSSLTGLLNIPNSVTNIRGNAFNSCSGIDSLIIGEGVVSIGTDAFKNCSGLTSVIFNADSCSQVGQYSPDRIFNGCTSLSIVTIGKHVKTIPERLFKGCSSLSTVYYNADSCTNASNAFSGTSLTSLSIGENVKHLPSSIFLSLSSLTGTLSIPDSVIVIGDYAFYGCTGLDTLDFGRSVASIGNSAFYNCTGLVGKLNIPNSVTSIGNSAFYGCSGFDTLVIGNSVTAIGSYAFQNCIGLSGTLNIPNSVTDISSSAFSGCSGFDTLIIGKSVQTIGYQAFQNCTGLIHVVFNADSCTTMTGSVSSYYSDRRALKGCTNISSLTIGENVKNIPAYAFSDLNQITGTLIIPDSVVAIRTSAFSSCSGLTSLSLGRSVDSICSGAFSGCTGLSSITSYNVTPPVFELTSTYPFSNVSRTLPVYVPCGSAQAYRNVWRQSSSSSNSYFYYIYETIQPYLFTVLSEDTLKGSVQIATQPTCTSPAVIEATPNFFYVFDHWSDGNTDNPRTLTLTQDTTLVAHFREYELNINCDTNYGHIVFLQMPTAENPQAVVQVEPNPCYLFGYWTDYKHSGSSVWPLNEEYDNPRTITLSQDTTMEVSFRYAHPVDISSDRTSLCEGDSTVLKGVTYSEAWSGNTAIPSNSVTEGFLWVRYIPTGAGTYNRDTLGLEDSIVVSTAGIYRVMGIDSTGCIAYSTISIEVHPYPTIMISGETEICAGNSTTLTAGFYEFSEDFTNGIPSNWTTSNETLETYTLSGNGGTALLFPAYNLPNNSMAELILPNINMKQFDKPYMQFKMAYRGKLTSCNWNYSDYGYTYQCDTIRNEDLSVMLSADNGSTWVEVFRASNDYDYYSLGGTTEAFYPSSLQTEYTNLSNFSNYENVIIKFVFTGGQGNNMWLDNVRIYSTGYEYLPTVMWSNGSWEPAQTFDSTGTWQVTVSNIIGWNEYGNVTCSSTDSVTINIWQPSDTTEVTVNTPENYYVMNGETFCTSGDYTQTLQNIHGCDSVVKLHLTLTPSITVVNDTVYGKYRYSTANTYINIYGTKESYQYKMTPDKYAHWADSVLTDWLDWSEMDSTYIHLSYDSITNMASMNFEYVNVYRRLDGNVYRDEFFYLDNTYTDSSFYDFSDTLTLQTSVGCDSTIIWNTRIFFRDYVELHGLEECSFTWQGDSLFITDPIYQETVVGGIGYGDTLTESGTYLQKLINTNGCDSTVHLSLTIHPAVYEEITITACDSCILNGVTYMESGDYIQNTDTMFTTIRKMIYSSWRGWGYTDIYGNFVAFWPNGWSGIEWNIDPETNTVVSYSYFDQFGIEHPYVMGDTIPYTDTMPACKITTLHLTLHHSVTNSFEVTACDSYTWNDNTYTTSGEYIQTFTSANGCDSVVTLQLTVNESKHTDTTAESCGSYTWNETTYTSSGEYTQTFTSANGCDSTVTLQLTILPLPTPNITGVTTVCEGQTATLNATGGVSYLWEDGTTTNTYPATVSGLYTVTVTNAEGCSATASTTVTVNPLPEVAITGNTAICPGGSTVLTATGADSYQWSNGSTNASIPVNAFGQYSVIGTNATGCFSNASVTVLVSQPPVITISGNTDICAGESTTLTANGGVSYMWSNGSTADTLVATTAGSWQVIGYNADGCSNMASVTVNVWQPASSDLYITAFDSCYMWFGTPRCESGNYTYTLQTIHGCDSVITLHLTLEDAITTEFNATSCDSYTWNGATYTVSGNYTQSFTAFNGNDSIVTLHLTINNPVHTAFTAESCGAYDWNDQTYTVSGDYTYEHLDANGCTQVDTLHLTIFNPVHTAITAGSCGSYVWNGQTYTVSGDYTYEHLDANGCTQVDTLHLTIFNPVHTAITAGSCGSYVWNGQTYTVSGDYTYEHLDANGCTQVDTLHLTVNDTKHVEFADSTCTAYTWNGQTYASSGDYTQTFTAANGCDSVVTLHLTIVPTITPAIAVTGSLTACDDGSATLSVPGDYNNFVWSTGAITPTITVSEAGYYWVTATDAYGCEGVSEMVQLGGSTQIDETPAICMVDVEDNHNLLIWEELSDPDVASYRIYRENNQANVFEPLAVIPAGSVNAFADSTADPSVRAWRYKITAADTCGGETPMSGYHKTVHLTINQGLGNSWNLIWTPYEGLEFASYKLYRGTANNNLQLIQTMPATLTSYTDNNPSGDALFYQIEVVMTEGCVQQTRDITHTGARSNIVYNQVPVMAEETVSACENYDWNGQTITSSGDYTQTFVSELGYDSVVTLHLTIHHTPVFSISGNLAISQGQSTALSVPNNAGWSYLWNTGETASVIIVTPTETTGYSVTVTEGTCNASDSVTVTVNTGIDDHDGFDFTVYPNPTTNIVNVQCTMYNVQAGTMEFHVFDAYGKLVGVVETRYTTSLQTVQIDLSHYASGVYFVKAVADGNVVAVRKVVKR